MRPKIFRARRPPELVRVHFTTDVVQSRAAIRAALDRALRRRTREGWHVAGEALQRRVQVSIGWQNQPAAAQRLTGNFVEAPQGGCDFVGELSAPHWQIWALAICILLYGTILLCGAIWLGAICLGAQDVAHVVSPVARLVFYSLPWLVVPYLDYRRAKARPEGAGEALKGWLTGLAAEASDGQIQAE